MIFHVIYYASKTLNDPQLNYAAAEKELLVVVYAFDKFQSYLWGQRSSFTQITLLSRHFGASKIAAKILQSSFYWPTLFKDAFEFVKRCGQCQRIGKLRSRWSGPYTITQVFPHGAVEITHDSKGTFKINGQHLKYYWGSDFSKEKSTVHLRPPE
ncbi:uncharacterized protein LOC111376296 [Olea europaea var. sylvestris]|uniref:uncharacterized protein LOC111376296 n=1 Tax=Olea europaea var. sylvestris TaxID=158386 RepID=UPI000C1D17F7|nr:uncharacterized protein LOC111376296 [Olea europaea var. sylvestris]